MLCVNEYSTRLVTVSGVCGGGGICLQAQNDEQLPVKWHGHHLVLSSCMRRGQQGREEGAAGEGGGGSRGGRRGQQGWEEGAAGVGGGGSRGGRRGQQGWEEGAAGEGGGGGGGEGQQGREEGEGEEGGEGRKEGEGEEEGIYVVHFVHNRYTESP